MYTHRVSGKVFFCVAAVLVAGCQQLFHSELDYAEQYCRNEHAKHCREVQDEFNDFQQQLKKAVSAKFTRVVGDCCCTGGELQPLKDVAVSKAEFAELVSILAQAQALPPANQEVVLPIKYAPKSPGEKATLVVPDRPEFINDGLRLYDAKGEVVIVLGMHGGIGRIQNAESYRAQLYNRPDILLSDAAIDRLTSLRAYSVFLKQMQKDFDQEDLPGLRSSGETPEEIKRLRPSRYVIVDTP